MVDDTQVVGDVFCLYRKQNLYQSRWRNGGQGKGGLTNRVDKEARHDHVPLSNVFSAAISLKSHRHVGLEINMDHACTP